ncbi:hypothetical protein CcaverHIS002_0602720 [Cutaneotrichosporon cavernicola]|uniref:BTB domain-containing protein n=1 Tax=Cutaneotrichosporon cavernicola TaxID=279322 RepID=A0AA48L8D3_9TREE|nr:uncharacterized protein CcaverHIS019_0602200 [Cutaneotrichosporon cavernicola]BEI85985.1 hypothetical protein CcaverHIS002_0602720 [Cutaneotrichosporon cavernicola]BEI93761.1 hypothetical protein CcaverHIS019_0602200 [Cutaneotrichosporon cavernicola]BEJ01539.1 hypothetical protein CcaverHIS631_0602210 [Cutaneotrichosporon cavernicola]BEJ09303.1 hypothetical protein CcaverHIS641_0602180 [Cutaneotrichosporon cavernicola]
MPLSLRTTPTPSTHLEDDDSDMESPPPSPPRLTYSKYSKRSSRTPQPLPVFNTPSPFRRITSYSPDGGLPKSSSAAYPPTITEAVTDSEADSSGSVVDDDEWTHGDFEIRSADGVRFRVPSYLVLASSPVFRDAHALNNGIHKITFLDSTYETAPVLRLWLQHVSQGLITVSLTLPHFKELTLFLLKWEMESCLNNLSAHLEVAVRRRLLGPTEAFVVAACAGDVSLCHLVLTVFRQDTWPNATTTRSFTDRLRGKVGESVWDPRYWSASFWEAVPQRYLFAVARAYGEGNNEDGALAIRFKEYLLLLGDWS